MGESGWLDSTPQKFNGFHCRCGRSSFIIASNIPGLSYLLMLDISEVLSILVNVQLAALYLCHLLKVFFPIHSTSPSLFLYMNLPGESWHAIKSQNIFRRPTVTLEIYTLNLVEFWFGSIPGPQCWTASWRVSEIYSPSDSPCMLHCSSLYVFF